MPIPYPPFLAFGPLDVWFRLLFSPRAQIPARYWPRVVLGLIISLLVTILTLPERLLLALWFRLKKPKPGALPGPIFILGYYRSGTTHLQYLLDCDPNLYSPKWSQVLSPQGFLFSWTILRFVLLPFLSRTRPQDNVAFGANVPAEDDFALNNWALACTLPGRTMVPQLHSFYDRFHDLKGLTPAEMSRWRRYQFAFVRKLALIAGRRRILLKTPTHTARIPALLQLFSGAGQPKFIHITRNPHSVLRSNISLSKVMNELYGLQDPLPPEQLEDYLVNEFVSTEQNYLESRSLLAPGQVAQVRLQDLQADPIGELKRVYAELGLPYTEEFEQRVLDYLDVNREYTPNVHPQWTEGQKQRLLPLLEPFIKLFRHDQPTIAKHEPPLPAHVTATSRAYRVGKAAALGLVTSLACLAIWLVLANLIGKRCEQMLWPTGIAVGLTTIHAARRGSSGLGLWAAFLTVLILAGVAVLNTQMSTEAPQEGIALANLCSASLHRFATFRTLLYSVLGIATAYRLGSQPQP